MALTVRFSDRPENPGAASLDGPIEDLYAVLVAARRDLNAMTGAPGLSLEAKNRYSRQAAMVARAMEDVPEDVRRAFHVGTMAAAPAAPVAEKPADPAPEESDDEDLF